MKSSCKSLAVLLLALVLTSVQSCFRTGKPGNPM
jgi:hypothetical protein